MRETVIMTTSTTVKAAVDTILAEKLSQEDEPLIRRIHFEFSEGPRTNSTESISSTDTTASEVLAIDSAYRTVGLEELDTVLKKVLPSVEERIRKSIYTVRKAKSRTLYQKGNYAHLIILGAFYQHESNLLTLLGLKAAASVQQLLSQDPPVRIDIVAAIPSGANSVESQATCFAFLEAIQQEVSSGQERFSRTGGLVGLCEDELNTDEEDEPTVNHNMCEAIGLLLFNIDRIQSVQEEAGVPSGRRSHFALFGSGEVLYRPGDFLSMLAERNGPDFRKLFHLRPFERDDGFVPLQEKWRKEIADKIPGYIYRDPKKEAPQIPKWTATISDSESLSSIKHQWLMYLKEVKEWHQQRRQRRATKLESQSQPLSRDKLEEATQWLMSRWDRLINELHLPLAGAEIVARLLVKLYNETNELIGEDSERAEQKWREPPYLLDEELDWEDFLDLDIVSKFDEHLVRLCRGALGHPFDPLVKDLELREAFRKNLKLTDYLMEKIRRSGELAVQIRWNIILRFPWGYPFPGGEKLIEAMEEELERFPADLILETQGSSLEPESYHRMMSAMLRAHIEQLRLCWARSEDLGRWLSVRQAIIDLREAIRMGAENLRKAFEDCYADTSNKNTEKSNRLMLANKLVELNQYAPQRLRDIAQHAQQAILEKQSPIAFGHQIRECAGDRGSIRMIDFLPREVAEALPLDLEKALLTELNSENKPLLFELLSELIHNASTYSEAGGDQHTDDDYPLILPILSVPGEISQVMQDHMRDAPDFFVDLQSRPVPWVVETLADAADNRVEVHYLMLFMPLERLIRYASLKKYAEKYQSDKGDSPESLGEIYRKVIETK